MSSDSEFTKTTSSGERIAFTQIKSALERIDEFLEDWDFEASRRLKEDQMVAEKLVKLAELCKALVDQMNRRELQNKSYLKRHHQLVYNMKTELLKWKERND